ncbi:MAG: hypothetical protein ACRDTV_17570 [Mycobacterium sp.]
MTRAVRSDPAGDSAAAMLAPDLVSTVSIKTPSAVMDEQATSWRETPEMIP